MYRLCVADLRHVGGGRLAGVGRHSRCKTSIVLRRTTSCRVSCHVFRTWPKGILRKLETPCIHYIREASCAGALARASGRETARRGLVSVFYGMDMPRCRPLKDGGGRRWNRCRQFLCPCRLVLVSELAIPLRQLPSFERHEEVTIPPRPRRQALHDVVPAPFPCLLALADDILLIPC